MNFTENDQLSINKYKYLKSKENKFIIYILFSLFYLISLFINVIFIRKKNRNSKNINNNKDYINIKLKEIIN